ncbi:MAG TPA: hypothetical protein VF713_15525 [Thermoanaerobaculia bacterium]
MARYSVDAMTITFDDGGMNLLSSDALREPQEIGWLASTQEPRDRTAPPPC